MSQSLLDKLDADPGGCRRFIAHAIVVGGANRAQVSAALAKRYGIKAPSTRTITTWQNSDEKLLAMIRELEQIKTEVAPGDDAQLPPEANRAQAAADLMAALDRFPAFERLFHRESERTKEAPPTRTAWGAPIAPPPPDDDDDDDAPPNEAFALYFFDSEGMSDAEFEAEALRRLDGWIEPEIVPKSGAGSLA